MESEFTPKLLRILSMKYIFIKVKCADTWLSEYVDSKLNWVTEVNIQCYYLRIAILWRQQHVDT